MSRRLGRRRPAVWLLSFFCLQTFAAPPGPNPHSLKLFTTAHHAMGTDFTLYLYATEPDNAASVSDEVFEEIDRLDESLSNYKPTSELSRINLQAAAAPVTTDPETFDFLVQSTHWSRISDGSFDLTVGSLMKTWGFYRHEGRIPPAEELDLLRPVTGWKNLSLDPKTRTVRFLAPGMELDPGGIGKGFAVDAAVNILRADHVAAALLSAGSSTLYALGAPPRQEGWRVVIPGPLPLQQTLTTVVLRDTSLSSADCSQKNFVADGHLYCHIMDPHTLRPVEGRIQVSIVNPSATASDALSNVIFVQQPEQSIATLQEFAPESRALIVFIEDKPDKGAHCVSFRWQLPIDAAHCALN